MDYMNSPMCIFCKSLYSSAFIPPFEIILIDPSSLLKNTKLGLIWAKLNISCLWFSKAVIAFSIDEIWTIYYILVDSVYFL